MIFIWFIIFLTILYIFEISIESYNNFSDNPSVKPDNCYYYVKNIAKKPITDRQKEVLYDLDAARSTQNMLTNREMQFTGGCAINPKRDLNYLSVDNKCNISGSNLSNEIDPDTGYRIPSKTNIKLLTQLDYAFPNVSPAYSCYIDTVDQNKFFKNIDTLADMKNFKHEQNSDKNNVDISKLNTKLNQYSEMKQLYSL